MMETAFLESIIADLDDDAPRLIFADWLDDNGDSARAEFIRVQCRLASDISFDERVDFEVRERELLDKHGTKWRKPFRKYVGSLEFVRGFPERISLSAKKFLEHAEAIFEVMPVRYAKLNTVKPVFDELVESAHLAKLRELSLNFNQLTVAQHSRLYQCPHLVNLEMFDMGNTGVNPRLLGEMLDSPYLPRLRRLHLAGNDLHDGLPRLFEWTRFGDLTHLRLSGMSEEMLLRLVQCPNRNPDLALSLKNWTTPSWAVFEPLAKSSLVRCWQSLRVSTARELALVVKSGRFEALTSLTVADPNFGEGDGPRKLARSPVLGQLTELNLSNCNLTDEAVEVLSKSKADWQVRELNLANNAKLTPKGLRFLLERGRLARVWKLKLERTKCGDGFRELLTEPTWWSYLEVLDLDVAGLTEDDLIALARSRIFPNLRALSMYGTPISLAAITELTRREAFPSLQEPELSDAPEFVSLETHRIIRESFPWNMNSYTPRT